MTDLDALLKAMELKDEKRTGWEIKGIEDSESVADHTWGTAFLCLLFGPEEDIDLERTLKIAIVHDIAEAETGDFATRASEELQEISNSEKSELEEKVISNMTDSLEKEEIRDIWEEYESRTTDEAKFVKTMDMIDMVLQALKYEENGLYTPEEDVSNSEFEHLDEFFVNAEEKITTDKGKELFQQIKERYEEAKQD